MIQVENSQQSFVLLWLLLERTRRLLGCQCKRYCIRNVLKAWFGPAANDNMIWEVCHQCGQALDAAYSIAFPNSTPINVNKKKRNGTNSTIE